MWFVDISLIKDLKGLFTLYNISEIWWHRCSFCDKWEGIWNSFTIWAASVGAGDDDGNDDDKHKDDNGGSDEEDVGEKSDPYHPSTGKSKKWQLGGIFSHTHLTELAHHRQAESDVLQKEKNNTLIIGVYLSVVFHWTHWVCLSKYLFE